MAPDDSPVAQVAQVAQVVQVAQVQWLCFDTETALIAPGRLAPPLTCVSWVDSDGKEGLLDHVHGVDLVDTAMRAGRRIVGHNVCFDLAVVCAERPGLLPQVYDHFERGLVHDTMWRQITLDVAIGVHKGYRNDQGVWVPYEYSLQSLAKRYLGLILEKDEWRMRYGELRGVPIDTWPDGAKKYALDDARATAAVYQAQERDAEWMPDEAHRMRSAWWQNLTSVWGIRTRKAATDKLQRDTQAAYEEIEQRLISVGLVDPKKRSRNTKVAKALLEQAYAEQGRQVPLTDKGQTCLDAEACEESKHPDLIAYAEFSTLKKTISTDIPMLQSGVLYPIHTRFGMAASGRSTSSSPNIQNIRRMPGIRESFTPREGFVFAQGDYAGLELHTLAQCCLTLLGKSRLAEAINSGLDAHLDLAARMLRIPYDEAKTRQSEGDPQVKKFRQMAKGANFGLPGGLGVDTFILYCKAMFGVELSRDEADTIKVEWLRNWPEMSDYFKKINGLFGDNERATVPHLFSGRLRGGCTYTAACNTLFQGLGSDVANAAGWLISRACYVDRSSPLFNCRIVNFIHDEFILEVPDDAYAHERATELGVLMRGGADKFLPEVPAKVEPQLMRYWSKDAEPTYRDGRLVPWPAE